MTSSLASDRAKEETQYMVKEVPCSQMLEVETSDTLKCWRLKLVIL